MKFIKLLPVLGALPLLWAGHIFAAPIITSFSPGFGWSGDPGFITINGSGFSPGTLVVKFNGVTNTSAAAVTANQIQARVPTNTPVGSGPIFVSVNGQGVFSADDFTVIGPGPYISSFASVGAPGGGIMITGAHFTASMTVKFTGASSFVTNAGSTTRFSVIVPPGTITGPILLSNAQGSYTTSSNFMVPPTFKGFTPFVGRTGTNVLITGTNFLGATAVKFNSVDAAGFTVLSNNAIQATAPSGVTSGQLRVITPAGSVFSGSNFIVQPTITGFTPGFGPVGTSVTISGANFNVGTPTVKFGGVTAATPTGVTFGQLTAVVPAGATNDFISVTTTDGTVTSATKFYLPARITSVVPSNSPPGSLVVITGANFIDATALSFNGTPAAGFYVTNNTTLGAFVPANVTSGPLSITTPAGTTNTTVKFYAAPIINNFNPTNGLPGTNVLISGLNFLDTIGVTFNGTNAPAFTVLSNTTISVTVPANATTGPITVIGRAGTTSSALNFFLDYNANLDVTMTDAPDPVSVGSNLVYSIKVHNSGPFAAPNVILTTTLAGNAALVGATTTQGTVNTGAFPVTANLGQIPVSGDVFVTLTYVPQVFQTITNTATVASQYSDSVPANNSVTTTTLVQLIPSLTVDRSGTAVRVSWHSSLTNYVLEFKPSIAPGGFWSNVTTVATPVGENLRVSEPTSQPARLYRLRRVP